MGWVQGKIEVPIAVSEAPKCYCDADACQKPKSCRRGWFVIMGEACLAVLLGNKWVAQPTHPASVTRSPLFRWGSCPTLQQLTLSDTSDTLPLMPAGDSPRLSLNYL